MKFKSTINGIPCLIHVTHFEPGEAPSLYSPGCGDEWAYEVLDRNGRPAPWLERYVNNRVENRLYEEYRIEKQAQERELAETA